jgi:hypothetical protein
MMFGEKDISREARVRVKGNQFQGPVVPSASRSPLPARTPWSGPRGFWRGSPTALKRR